MSRGYFEIGVYHSKAEVNIGTLWRSAYQLGATGIFTIGKRYKEQASDVPKAYRHIPLRHYVDFDDFLTHRPFNSALIGIEFPGKNLNNFVHPERCVYLLGAEDHGLPSEIVSKCQQIVSIESVNQPSYNVAVAGSIVMYDRFSKQL